MRISVLSYVAERGLLTAVSEVYCSHGPRPKTVSGTVSRGPISTTYSRVFGPIHAVIPHGGTPSDQRGSNLCRMAGSSCSIVAIL